MTILDAPSLTEARSSRHSRLKDWDLLGWVLIIFSSILLGIWAVRGTIALRNTLLVGGAILSVVYCVRFFKDKAIHIPLKNWTPFIFLGLMFCWVVTHYFFFARFPVAQFHELTSTWLRSGLAAILAVGTGLAISRRPVAINCLWLGILISFFYLFYQYVPKAINAKSLFAIDYGYYIYPLKINGVLMGTILVTGLTGTFLDATKKGKAPKILFISLFFLTGIVAALYSYVFIFDSRNGIGLTAILLFIMSLLVQWRVLASLLMRGVVQRVWRLQLIIVCLFVLVGWFGLQHTKHNSGWSTMWEDAKTSVQVKKYNNWQNPRVMGYPINEAGEIVKGNTYERLAWAVAGIQIFLPENPLGVGILNSPFSMLLKQKYPQNNGGSYIPSTHSAWIEIALAFGYPGVFLLLSSLSAILYLSFTQIALSKILQGYFL